MNPAMYTGPQLRLRIDFAPGCSVGPGKVGLLEAIERCGSCPRRRVSWNELAGRPEGPSSR